MYNFISLLIEYTYLPLKKGNGKITHIYFKINRIESPTHYGTIGSVARHTRFTETTKD